jgi:hypothetical protein
VMLDRSLVNQTMKKIENRINNSYSQVFEFRYHLLSVYSKFIDCNQVND